MSDEQTNQDQGQDQQPAQGAEEKKDRWDELMGKLDAITDTLRKACAGETEEAPKAESDDDQGGQSQEEGQDQPGEGEDQPQG